MTAETVSPPSARAPEKPAHVEGDFAAAIYGSILATSLVVALGHEHLSAVRMLGTLLATMGVFYLAHVWAAVSAERIETASGFSGVSARAHAIAEWPMIEAASAPGAALLLAVLGVYSVDTAVDVATVVGVANLVAWGFAIGHRSHHRRLPAFVSGLINGAFGVAIVVLETSLH